MTSSSENLLSPLINPSILDISIPGNYIETYHEELQAPTTITVISESRFPDTLVSSMEKSVETIPEYEHHQPSRSKRACLRRLSIATISRQLGIRKFLQNRLSLISNIMCLLGLLGVILMIIENEMTFLSTNTHDTIMSCLIKLMITLSTIVLIGLLIYYHYLILKLYATQNLLDNWRAGLTIRRMFRILCEILICAIHPIPLYCSRNWLIKQEHTVSNVTISDISENASYTTINVALSLPMFARFYLISRCIMCHSHLVRDAPLKSFGSFNKVSINSTFLIKTYLEQRPARCLIMFCITTFFIGSWSIRACDYRPSMTKHISIFDSMWLFIITFTTVGYGDMIPTTYCGRSIVAIIALFGLLSSALLISVVAQKLQLTRWEKYVNNFVKDIELNRRTREQAANIIKFAIKSWYLKRKYNHQRYFQHVQAQRMLSRSIHKLRQIKHQQRKLTENCLGLVELINIQRYTTNKTKRIAKEISIIKSTIDKLEEKLNDMQYTLHLLLDKRKSENN